MKKLILISLLFLSCGQNQPASFSNGGGCSTSQLTPSSVLPNGGAIIQCSNGSSSLISNGTLILPVQFCPGTTIYPSTFVEQGFCINNELWAVYSLNGGFLTLIPPGNYSSNGINSSCNFQVLANCLVINN